MSIGAALLMLVFGMALAYAAGRADRRELRAHQQRAARARWDKVKGRKPEQDQGG